MAPQSSPAAWNNAPAAVLVTTRRPGTVMLVPGMMLLVGGSASSTTGGTMKLPSLVRAVQMEDAPPVSREVVP